jgi:iron complex transport system substrate-binding protein
MIDIAGGNYLLASPGVRAQTVDFKQLQEVNPDVVLIKPCGFDLQKTLQEYDSLKASFLCEKWNAAKTKSIYCIDGNNYFNRPGPRIIDSLEILACCTHPKLFPEFSEKYSSSIQRMN